MKKAFLVQSFFLIIILTIYGCNESSPKKVNNRNLKTSIQTRVNKTDSLPLDFSSCYMEPWIKKVKPEQELHAWFIYLKPGQYHIKLNGRTDSRIQRTLKMEVNHTADGALLCADSFMLTKEKKMYTSDFNITQEAFYKISLKPRRIFGGVSINDVALLSTDGDGYIAKWLTSPSVHLKFFPDDGLKYEYDWLYGEILVPEGFDPLYTYWECIGFHRGYFGIQTNSFTERRVLFSVWDSSKEAIDRSKVKEDDKVVLMDKNSLVHAGSFGNEGTGGQTYWRYNWKTGIPMKFLMNVRKLPNNTVVYSAWIMDMESEGWKYVASWRTPKENRYFDGFYSFIENFGVPTGQCVRKGEYSNMWGYRVNDKKWIEFNKAKLTYTDGEPGSRSDYDGGLVKGKPSTFYLSSGGYAPPAVSPSKLLVATPSGKEPVIDMKTLSQRVDNAIKKSVYLSVHDKK